MNKIPGNLQKIHNGKRRYAITPRIPGGFIQPELMIKLAEVAQKFHGVLKITGGQRIMITNLKKEDLESAWAMLGMSPAYTTSNVVRSVKICPGTTFCKRAKQDSIHLGMQLDRKYVSQVMPSKVKMGVSGCPNSCSEAITKDIGIIGTEHGWEIYVGGSAGAHPRIGFFLIAVKEEQDVLSIIDSIMTYYKEQAQIERIGVFIDRINFNTFREEVLKDFTGTILYLDPTKGTDACCISAKANGLHYYQSKHAPNENISIDTGNHHNEEYAPNLLTSLIKKANSTQTHNSFDNSSTKAKLSHPLHIGDAITKDSIIRDIIDMYPETIPILQEIGMGCLGCPSATGEPLWQAAEIHGISVNDLIEKLESIRKK